MIFKDDDDDMDSSSKGATPKEEEEIEGAPVAAIAEANAEVKADVKALIKAAENAEAKELSMRSGREVKSSVCEEFSGGFREKDQRKRRRCWIV